MILLLQGLEKQMVVVGDRMERANVIVEERTGFRVDLNVSQPVCRAKRGRQALSQTSVMA